MIVDMNALARVSASMMVKIPMVFDSFLVEKMAPLHLSVGAMPETSEVFILP